MSELAYSFVAAYVVHDFYVSIFISISRQKVLLSL